MNCVICNKEIEKSKYTNAVLCSDECFHDHFWQEHIKNHDDQTVIVNGTRYHYTYLEEKGYFSGHGGREFKIKFHDGRIVQTRNLWCQGNIPEKYREQLPDNAIFLESDQSIKNKEKRNNLFKK